MTRELEQSLNEDRPAPAQVESESDAQARAELAASLDGGDPEAILFFGTKVQHHLSRISRKMLETVAGERVDGAGQAIDEMLDIIRGFDLERADPNVKPPWWKRWWPAARPLTRLVAAIESLRLRVEQAARRLEREKSALLSDVVTMDRLDERCREHLRELDLHLGVARGRLDGAADGRQADLLKRLEDLTVSRQIGQQARASMLLVQQTGRELISRVNFVLTATVPAWQQHLTQLIAIWRRRKAAELIGASSELAEDLAGAAGRLRGARERVREALRAGVYDLDAIAEANRELAAELEQGRALAERGREARAQALSALKDEQMG